MQKNNFLIIVVIVGILSFIAGFFVEKGLTNKQQQNIVLKTRQEIKSRLVQGERIEPDPETIYSLGGKVMGKGKDYLIVAPSLTQDPFQDLFPSRVRVNIGKDTKITKMVLIAQEKYTQIRKEYEKNKTGEVPSPFLEKEGNFNHIKVGDEIISARSNINIKHLSEFTASLIQFKNKE